MSAQWHRHRHRFLPHCHEKAAPLSGAQSTPAHHSLPSSATLHLCCGRSSRTLRPIMAPQEGSVGEVGSPERPPVSNLKLTAFKRFPTNYPHNAYYQWLNAKQIDDAVGPYWRIHNKLYDLTPFISQHPGGKMWLAETKGTDITEAFESAHISNASEKLLHKYYVKDISTPRNSPYTFHEDGFYKTFKRKVRPILAKTGRGPSWKATIIQDALGLTFVTLALAAASLASYTLAVLAGMVLALTANGAHNFFHQRDNWRVYYFDLAFVSSHEWRVTHALSHHQYPNTANDFEISMVEPFWQFLPKPDKTLFQRYGSYVYELVLMPVTSLIGHIKKYADMWSGKVPVRPEYFLPYVELLVMAALAPSLGMAVKLFLVMHLAMNTVFLTVGLTAAHHHPDIFHDGDRMRKDRDWGLCQIDAIRDRVEVTGNLFLVMISYGDHTLHHLLPTVDHSKLNNLYPAFLETCKQFNIPFSFMHWSTLIVGKYRQMANNKPNTAPPGYKKKTA